MVRVLKFDDIIWIVSPHPTLWPATDRFDVMLLKSIDQQVLLSPPIGNEFVVDPKIIQNEVPLNSLIDATAGRVNGPSFRGRP